AVIPNRKMKHSVETRQTFFAPLSEGAQQNFRVGLGLKNVTLALQLFAQLAVVVNLAAEREDVTTIGGKHWLMAGVAGVDDGQATMTERHAAARVVNSVRSPNAFVVPTTMLDRLKHRADVSLRVEAD